MRYVKFECKMFFIHHGDHVQLCLKPLLSSTLMRVMGQQDQPGRLLTHLQKIGWGFLIRI